MPHKNAELPQFFESVEQVFVTYKVPAYAQVELLAPLLTDQAAVLVRCMSDDHILVYDKVKQLLLRELGPAPEVYKCRFETATQTNDETYVQFASRLRKLLDDYLRSRRVTDFEDLCSLLVSNKIKAWLPSGMRKCVTLLEGNTGFTPDGVAPWADKVTTSKDTRCGLAPSSLSDHLCCWHCDSIEHNANDFPIIGARGSAGINHDNQEPPSKAQVNFCATLCHPLVSECNPDHVVKQDDTIRESRENWEFGEFPDVDARLRFCHSNSLR